MPEEVLRDHEFLRELFEKAPLPYQSLDEDGRVLRVNRAWLDLLGYGADEVLGRPVGEFLTPASQELLTDRFARFIATGRVTAAGFELIRKDGSVVPVEINGTIARDPDGGFLRTHCILLDLSERLAAERLRQAMDQRLLHAQKLEGLEVMAGGIAHDFNNLLQTILGNADLALMNGSHPPELKSALAAIDKAARQAAELCRQMLAYAGRGEYAMARLRPDELVLDLEPLLRATISRKVDLRFELSPDVPAVLADAAQLRQVVVNLVTNAAEALGDGRGTVTVAAAARSLTPQGAARLFAAEDPAPGDYVVLAVRDTGRGMTDTEIGLIFDPFYSTKFTGRGLGLPMVRGVARAHGGAVAVESELGRGSCLEVWLPAAPEAAVPAPAPAAAAPGAAAGAGRTVLVADDDDELRLLVQRMFERLGWEAVGVADGAAAVDALASAPERYALVVLDWSMPVMDGREALAAIRHVAPDLPVFMSSGHAADALAAQVAHLHPTGFLVKPYRLAELRRALAAWDPATH